MAERRRTVNELLEEARRRLDRIDPREAHEAMRTGDAVIVDIRTDPQREQDGVVPGALYHPRNVLEWRLDPESGASDPALSENLERPVIIMCNAGYQSSLVAVTAQELGYTNATDLAGGFQAWRDAGLPVEPGKAG